MTKQNRIAVGVSGPATSYPAIDWALAYAGSVQAEVELVHVVDVGGRAAQEPEAEQLLLAAEHELREIAALHSARAGAPVHSTVLLGRPAQQLVEHAAGGQMLVLGTRTADKPGGYVFNPLAVRVAGRADVSTVIVPRLESVGHGIVVGIDGSEYSAAPLAFAAREADRLGEPLAIVHAWNTAVSWGGEGVVDWPSSPEDEDRRIVAEAIAGLKADYPDLAVDTEIIPGWAADVLDEAAHGARMLVVGSHGRHGFEKAWLGSTSEDLIFSMPTTVAVIR
ncbi:universal stress protein [soil metagenome]